MPRFAYEALDAKGKMVRGLVDAPNVESAIENLRTSKFTVTHVKARQDLAHTVNELTERYVPVKPYAVVVFTRQLATIFNSGIPLLKGLECIGGQSLDPRLTRIIAIVYQDVRSGISLSAAMARHPKAFSPVYLAMIRAGETAGALGDILNRLATLAERDYSLRRRVQAAMTYPIFVFVFALIATEAVVTYVFPTFVALLEGIGTQLPLPTKILIFVTKVSSNPICIAVAVVMAAFFFFLFSQFIKTRSGRMFYDRFLLSAPVIGMINQRVCLSRFCRTLGTLISSGVTMVHSVEIVGVVGGNAVLAAASEEIVTALKQGMAMSQPLRDNNFFPPMLHHMVTIGETSGNLPFILEKMAFFYDTEVEAMLNTFASLIEPIMVSCMGLLVAFVVLAVFLPIYSILGSFR